MQNVAVYKSLLCIVTTTTFDPAYFTELTPKVFEEKNLKPLQLLSQCSDGVSVMNGKKKSVIPNSIKALKNSHISIAAAAFLSGCKSYEWYKTCQAISSPSAMHHTFSKHGKMAVLYKDQSPSFGTSFVRSVELC